MSDRWFQLRVMGIVSLVLPPFAIILVMLIHGLPMPMSISETATMVDASEFLLPLCLGAYSLLSLTYALHYSYDDILDKIITASMCGGFFLVAVQKCASPYVTGTSIGLFRLTPEWSHIVHCVGAVVGFGAMILWIMLCFSKSNKPKKKQTKQKRLRNNLYYGFGWAMIASLGIFAFDLFGLLGSGFPTTFIAEWILLTFGGVACLIKGGAFLRDK